MRAALQAGSVSIHRWLVAAFVTAVAMTVAEQPAMAADPIAQIRVLGPAHVGDDVQLESMGENPAKAQFSWTLDQRPARSRASISNRNSARTSLRADVPGLYVVRLTVRLGNASATTTSNVTATDLTAAIRLLGRAHVGDDVPLESIGEHPAKVQLSWQLDQRPTRSRAKISDRKSVRTSFRADVPGPYVVRLTVRLRNASATATLNVTATDLTATAPQSGPLVSVNTIDTSQGTPATVIGSSTYPDPGSPNNAPGTGLHVVVVDRNTLAQVSINGKVGNQSYPVTSTGISQMQTDLGTLPTDGSVLVLVSLPASAGLIPSSLMPTLSNALNPIGGVLPQSWSFGTSVSLERTCWSSMVTNCFNSVSNHSPQWAVWPTGWSGSLTGWNGSFSVIGVPGMAIGSAWYDDAKQRGTAGNGALTGYLTRGAAVGGGVNSSAYVFVYGTDQYATVDTCATSSCVIQVNGQALQQSNGQSCPQPTGNGQYVAVLDRVTLQALVCQTVTNTAQLYASMLQSYAVSQWASGHFFVGPYFLQSPLSDRIIVILQSVGTGQLTGQLTFEPAANGDTGTALLQAIDQVGGTPETFGPAIGCGGSGAACGQPGQPYALVGVASNLPWHGKGVESSPIISTALGIPASSQSSQKGRIRAVLSRDRYARYTPTTFDPVGTATLDLASVVYQAPTAWPNAGSCAITYIADYLGLGQDYPDFRSAYTVTDINWAFYQPMFVPYPSSPPSYCNPFPSTSDYASIQSGLQNEVRWVANVNLFISALATPFVDTGSGQNTISQVAANILQSIQPAVSPSASTSTSWSNIFDLASSVGSVFFPDESSALGVLASVGTIAVDTMSGSSTANPAKTIIGAAESLATNLYNQTQAHLATLGNLQLILVSDWGKLSAVGGGVTTTYAWTNADTTAAIQALNATTLQNAYSALLPTVWVQVELKPDLEGLFNSSSVGVFCGNYEGAARDNEGPGCPYFNALSGDTLSSWFQLIVSSAPKTEQSLIEAWTLAIANPPWDTDPLYATVPTTVATGTLFSAASNGGAAYQPAWYRSTYNPPSFDQCGGNTGSECTEQHPMPVPPTGPIIGPPAAGYTLG